MADRTVTVKLKIDTTAAAQSLASIGLGANTSSRYGPSSSTPYPPNTGSIPYPPSVGNGPPSATAAGNSTAAAATSAANAAANAANAAASAANAAAAAAKNSLKYGPGPRGAGNTGGGGGGGGAGNTGGAPGPGGSPFDPTDGYMLAYQFRLREARRRAAEEERQERRDAAKRERQLAQQEAAKHGLGIQALGFAGMGGVAGHYGQMQLAGQHLSTLGFTGMGSLLNRAAIPIALAVEGEKLFRQYTKLAQNPYLSDTQRMMRFAEHIPLGSTVMDMARTYSGYDAQLAKIANEINPMAMLQVEKNLKQSNVGFDFNLQLRQRQSEAAAMQGYRAVGIPTGDRMTQFGRRQYEETSRLQAPLQQLEFEQRKLVAATRNRAINEDALIKTEAELVMLNKIRANAMRALTKTDGDDQLKLLQKGDVDRAEARFENAQRRYQELIDKRNAAAFAQDSAKLGVEQAQIAVQEAKATNSQQRAETAYANRLRLLNMGYAGRMQAQSATNTLNAMGTRAVYASPELIQQARGLSPQAVDELLLKSAKSDPFFERNKHLQGLEDPEELFKKADVDVKNAAETRAASQKATFDRAGETMATVVADGVKRLQEAFTATYRKEIDKIIKNQWGAQVQIK